MKRFSAGDTTDLTLYRAGESMTLSVTFGELKPDSTSDSPAKLAPAG